MNLFGWLMVALAISSALLFFANARYEKRNDGTWRATRREIGKAAACYVAVLALLIAMPAQAEEPWTGAQLMVVGNGSTIHCGTKLTGMTPVPRRTREAPRAGLARTRSFPWVEDPALTPHVR